MEEMAHGKNEISHAPPPCQDESWTTTWGQFMVPQLDNYSQSTNKGSWNQQNLFSKKRKKTTQISWS